MPSPPPSYVRCAVLCLLFLWQYTANDVHPAGWKATIVIMPEIHVNTGIYLVAALLLLFTLLYWFQFGKGLDENEPPWVAPKIPVAGHLIGMMMEGPRYFTNLL